MAKVTKKMHLDIISQMLKETSDSELLEFEQIIKAGRGHDKPYVPYTDKEVFSEIERRKLNKKS